MTHTNDIYLGLKEIDSVRTIIFNGCGSVTI